MKLTASTSQILHVDIVLALPLLYSVTMPSYSMCWPVSGCNVLCCRLLRRWIRCERSLFCTQLCHWSWWNHLPLKLPQLSSLDGLQPWFIYVIMLFMRTRCNRCVLNSVIIPRVLCVSALPIQGWHWCTETWSFEVWSLQDGIRAHADCRTWPLEWATGFLFFTHF